ncbi:hypothetical protein EVAR_14476_1 [Eumeta japonica]|uniref:Uncharacterized protein n=1 Tax=Eumeta variegata TaxID=151549 RepID=A0A4C1U376_EUMVA|nr:hypothetical protein EVAR_14476_1 [Eumeta japonica]
MCAVFLRRRGSVKTIKLRGQKTVTGAWCTQHCSPEVLQTLRIRDSMPKPPLIPVARLALLTSGLSHATGLSIIKIHPRFMFESRSPAEGSVSFDKQSNTDRTETNVRTFLKRLARRGKSRFGCELPLSAIHYPLSAIRYPLSVAVHGPTSAVGPRPERAAGVQSHAPAFKQVNAESAPAQYNTTAGAVALLYSWNQICAVPYTESSA